MKVQLFEILELDAFKKVDVIAGSEGLSKEVEDAYVMEVPDIISYIGSGGLLFTTLYPIINDKEALENFIPKLNDQGLAGVAIKPGRYVANIPFYMIEQAEELSFPLLLLPDTANFSMLTNEILTKLLGMKTEELEFRNNISKKFYNLLLNGGDIKDLISYVSKLACMEMFVANDQLNFIDSSTKESPTTFEFSIEEISERSSTKVNKHQNDSTSLIIDEEKYDKNDLIIHSIDAGRKTMGYLIILKNKRNRMSYLNIVIEQTLILLAFLLQKRQSLIQTERNYLDNFIRSILHTQYTSQADLIERAKIFKWKLHFPNIILLINIENNDTEIKLSNYYKVLNSRIISQTIARICEIPIENVKTALYNDQIICFVSAALVNDLSVKLKRASDIFIVSLKKYGRVSVGISERIYGMNEISEAYDEALLVQKIYKDVYASEQFVEFYKDIGVFKIFHLIEDKSALHDYVEEKVGVLIQNDQDTEMDLVKTLDSLIENNMNIKESSKDLYVHYNTLRYRIDKIKELGINLSSGNELTELGVALQLMKYLNYEL